MSIIKGKTPLLQCVLAHALNHTQILVLAALLPLFQDHYALSYLETEGIIALYLFCYAISNPAAGLLIKKFSKTFLVFSGKIVSGFSMAAMAIVSGYPLLLFVQIPFGAAGGLYHPLGTSILAESYDKKIRGRIMGYHGFGSSMGMILGPLGVGYFILNYDYKGALFFFAVLSVMVGVLFYGTVKESPMKPAGVLKRDTRWVIIAFALRESVFWGVKAFLPLYAVAVYGFSLSSAAALLALLPVIGLPANLLGGYLGDRFDRLRTAKAAVTMTGVSLLAFYVITDALSFHFLVLVTALWIYMSLPLFDSLVADTSPGKGYVEAYGVMYGLGFFLGAAVTLGTGFLSDAVDPRGSFILLAGIMFMCLFALMRAEMKDF